MAGRPQIIVDVIEAPPIAIVARSYFLTAERAEDLVDPMFDAVEMVTEQIRYNFESESSAGVPWEPWSIFYRQKRQVEDTTREEIFEKRLPSGQMGLGKREVAVARDKILQLTGELKQEAENVANWNVEQSGRDVTALMENIPEYGVYHITGVPENYLPVRDWAFVPDDVLDRMDERFLEFIFEDF